MQNWLNRAGLIFQFVALFLVTPEIFGEEKVRAATMKYAVGPLVAVVAFLRRHRFLRTCACVVLAVGIALGWVLVHVGISGSFTVILRGESLTDFLLILLVVGAVLYVLWRLAKLVASGAASMIDTAATLHRSFLPLGAFLFVVGFLLLMAATFVRPAGQ